jgi:hypothetical protein
VEKRERVIGRLFQILEEDNIGPYMVWGYARQAVREGKYDNLVHVATWEYHAGLPRPLVSLQIPLYQQVKTYLGDPARILRNLISLLPSANERP